LLAWSRTITTPIVAGNSHDDRQLAKNTFSKLPRTCDFSDKGTPSVQVQLAKDTIGRRIASQPALLHSENQIKVSDFPRPSPNNQIDADGSSPLECGGLSPLSFAVA